MTASTAKSTLITNLEASPSLQGSFGQTGNGLKVAFVTNSVATTSTDEQNDIFLFLPVPSGAVPVSLMVFNDDLDSGATPALAVDVGLYYGNDLQEKQVEQQLMWIVLHPQLQRFKRQTQPG